MSSSSGSSSISHLEQHKEARWRAALRRHWGAMAVGTVFLTLTLYYNVTIPLWESDYEWAHYQYVRYIATERRLPAPDAQIQVLPTGDACSPYMDGGLVAGHQFRQPPLYYLMGAMAVVGVDVATDLPLVSNPHVHIPFSQGGLNVAVHSEAERFPYHDTVLAVHRVRAMSGMIGLLGLVATYLSGLLLFTQRRHLALAMMAVNAFIPQYVFSASVINNDILVGALGSWCVFLSLYFVLHRTSFVALALAALAGSLAVVTKFTGLILLPVVGLALVAGLARVRHEDKARFRKRLWPLLGVVTLSCIPLALWLARNRVVTGRFLGPYADVPDAFVRAALTAPVESVQSRLLDPLYAAGFALMTFWGLFGNDNVPLPSMVLLLLQVVAVTSLAGVAWVLFDRRQPAVLRIAAAASLVIVVGAFVINVAKATGTSEPRGRYFLPIYSVISFLLVLGIDRLTPARWKTWGAVLLPGLLLVLTIAIPALVLRPAYAPPPIETSTALHPGEESLNAAFGDFAELLGYRIEPQRIGLYETAEVTLVWRALAETANNYTVAVQLLDGAGVSLDQRARFPGGGNFATSLWKPGDVFRDTYRVRLAPQASGVLPSLGRIKVAMYCFSGEPQRQLDVTDQLGNRVGDAVYLERIKLAAVDARIDQQPDAPLLFSFGDEIGLEQARFAPHASPAQLITVIDLTWRALSQPAQDYTVFLHLVDSRGIMVTSYDRQLTDGYYPSGLWDAGESVAHVHHLPLDPGLPEGVYSLRMGLYDAQTGVRLPAVDAHGVEQPDGIVTLGSLRISGEATAHLLFLPLALRNHTIELRP